MFKKFLLIGALCISAVMILGTYAMAVTCAPGTAYGCKKVSGRYVCTCWAVGTTELTGMVTGGVEVGAQFVGDIFGTIQDNRGWCMDEWDGDPKNGVELVDPAFDPDCLIAVYALCGPKKCAKDWNLPGCIENVSINSSHYNKDQVPYQLADLVDCKRGNCKTLIEWLEGEGVCPNGLVVLTAFANYFNGVGAFCEQGFIKLDGIPYCGENHYLDPAFPYSSKTYNKVDPYTAGPGTPYITSDPVTEAQYWNELEW